MALTDPTWYTLISDQYAKKVVQSFPADFTSSVVRALVVYGPQWGPFGAPLSDAGISAILAQQGVSATTQDLAGVKQTLANRALTERILGANRNLYSLSAFQVEPYLSGTVISDVLDPRTVVVPGAQGSVGATGAAGAAGPQGPTGPAGAIGPQGSTGPAGPAGADGAAGPAGPAGANGADGGSWRAMYDCDFSTAAVTDLSAGVNPTLTVNNDSTVLGVPPSVTWTSNAGDATATVTQVSVGGFGANGTGIRIADDGATNMSMTSTQHAGPHIWASWADFLGSPPAPGTQYCVMLRILSENLTTTATSADAVYVAAYNPNDGLAPTEIAGNTAKNDEKRVWAALEHDGTRVTGSMREGATDRSQIFGSRLPAGYNVVALVFNSGVQVDAGVGVYAGGAWPDPSELVRIDSWLGAQLGFTSVNYLDPEERIAIGIAGTGTGLDVVLGGFRVLQK